MTEDTLQFDGASQNERILAALKAGERLTPLQILDRFGCLRASGRIYDLKKQGHNIITDMVKVGDKRVAQYRLET